jgi:hypothetical protein
MAGGIADAGGKQFSVGSRGPAGGIIVYDKGSVRGGWRYIEAAPEDQSRSIMWWDVPFIYVGGTGTVIGSGWTNTAKIIKSQGKGHYAAILCAEYRGGGKSDWFLPSKNELVLLRKALPGGREGGLTGKYYWSSSEVDGSLAWRVGENDDDKFADGKDCTGCVRAIRMF